MPQKPTNKLLSCYRIFPDYSFHVIIQVVGTNKPEFLWNSIRMNHLPKTLIFLSFVQILKFFVQKLTSPGRRTSKFVIV